MDRELLGSNDNFWTFFMTDSGLTDCFVERPHLTLTGTDLSSVRLKILAPLAQPHDSFLHEYKCLITSEIDSQFATAAVHARRTEDYLPKIFSGRQQHLFGCIIPLSL
jgi:hypothetical protein